MRTRERWCDEKKDSKIFHHSNLDKPRFRDPHIHNSYIIILRSKRNKFESNIPRYPNEKTEISFHRPPSRPLPPCLPSSRIEQAHREKRKKHENEKLGKGWVGGVMSAPRKKRCEGEHGSRVYASGSCVWRLARVASLVAHARMWASIRDPVHATLSLSFCHTHASLRSSTCTHTRVHARARAHRCAGVILARARVRRTKRKIRGRAFTRRGGQDERFYCSNK